MKIKGRAIWIVLTLIISLALPFSCTKEKEPYKVGAVFSVTGRASFLGEPEKKTWSLELEPGPFVMTVFIGHPSTICQSYGAGRFSQIYTDNLFF